MAIEKDPWGDKLRAAERAREDLYFAKIDQALIERLRRQRAAADKEGGDCPRCRETLRSGLWRDLEIEFCPSCGGLWLDPGDLLHLAQRQDVGLALDEREAER
jgi:hypothetical protein